MTSESSRLLTPVPVEHRAWFARIWEQRRPALEKCRQAWTWSAVKVRLAVIWSLLRIRQAWSWSRPRLIRATAASAHHGWRGMRRARLLSRGMGRRVMARVNAFDASLARGQRRPPRRTTPPAVATKAAPTAKVRASRAETPRPATGGVAAPAIPPSVRPGTSAIARLSARPTTGALARPAAPPLVRKVTVDVGRATGSPVQLHCWSCTAATNVTGARLGGCYYCSRCGKLMTAINLATGRTRAFTGRSEIGPDETEPGGD